jgi:DNA-binding response OmpR family regulator
VPASSILVIEADPTSDASPAPILAAAGYTVTRTGDADEGFGKIADHQLAIIDVGLGAPRSSRSSRAPRSGMDICREIRATPAMSAVPILCVAASDEVEE